MQRWLVQVRKLIAPQRDVIASLVSGMVLLPGMTAESDPYLRDLYDHLIRINDMIDSYRDLLSNAMSAYLSMVSNNLNVVMKQLTIIATVFLPLSFLTGFFGQNFALAGRPAGLAADVPDPRARHRGPGGGRPVLAVPPPGLDRRRLVTGRE